MTIEIETDPMRLKVKEAMRSLTEEQRTAIANSMRLNFNLFRGGHCTITQMEGYCFHLVFGDEKQKIFKYLGVGNEVEGQAKIIAE